MHPEICVKLIIDYCTCNVLSEHDTINKKSDDKSSSSQSDDDDEKGLKFPDPIDFSKLDDSTVERVIRRRISDTERHTFIAFKPDENGRLKLETYKQK